jgi:hypothetical protein
VARIGNVPALDNSSCGRRWTRLCNSYLTRPPKKVCPCKQIRGKIKSRIACSSSEPNRWTPPVPRPAECSPTPTLRPRTHPVADDLLDHGSDHLTPYCPGGSVVSAWRLRLFPGKPSVSNDFLPKRPRNPIGVSHKDPLRRWVGYRRRFPSENGCNRSFAGVRSSAGVVAEAPGSVHPGKIGLVVELLLSPVT